MSRMGLAAAALLLSTSVAQASPFEFRGFYAGFHAGYVDATTDVTGGDLDGGSAMGGAQFGYNFLNGNLLYGVELDFSLAGVGPEGTCPYASASCDLDMGPMGTLRGRLGYAFDDWLIYATGGAAASHFEFEQSGGPGGTSHSKGGLHGWTVGAGVEYLIGDIVGVKMEYRYLRFGDFGGFEDEVEDGLGNDIDVHMHVIMGGINYHF